MGKINLARVDDRLIHGCVMVKWSKGSGTNAIYVIDNATAADDFLKMIYVQTNSSANLKIKVFSDQELIDKWNKDQFENDKVILIFKSPEAVKKVVDGGVPIDALNVGGIAKTPQAKFVISSVGIDDKNEEILRYLHDEKGVEVYFQIVPDTPRVEWETALKKLHG